MECIASCGEIFPFKFPVLFWGKEILSSHKKWWNHCEIYNDRCQYHQDVSSIPTAMSGRIIFKTFLINLKLKTILDIVLKGFPVYLKWCVGQCCTLFREKWVTSRDFLESLTFIQRYPTWSVYVWTQVDIVFSKKYFHISCFQIPFLENLNFA